MNSDVTLSCEVKGDVSIWKQKTLMTIRALGMKIIYFLINHNIPFIKNKIHTGR